MSNLVPFSYQQGYGWHVVYTNIKCEARAAMGLRGKGFEVFMPTETVSVVKRRKRFKVHRPLFSRYLFVGFDIDKDEWGEIKTVDGVEDLICMHTDGHPIPMRVPEAEIERLMRAQDAGVFDQTRKPVFNEGDQVSVEEGAFRGFIARVKSATARKRVKILLSLFGGVSEVEIDASALRRVA